MGSPKQFWASGSQASISILRNSTGASPPKKVAFGSNAAVTALVAKLSDGVTSSIHSATPGHEGSKSACSRRTESIRSPCRSSPSDQLRQRRSRSVRFGTPIDVANFIRIAVIAEHRLFVPDHAGAKSVVEVELHETAMSRTAADKQLRYGAASRVVSDKDRPVHTCMKEVGDGQFQPAAPMRRWDETEPVGQQPVTLNRDADSRHEPIDQKPVSAQFRHGRTKLGYHRFRFVCRRRQLAFEHRGSAKIHGGTAHRIRSDGKSDGCNKRSIQRDPRTWFARPPRDSTSQDKQSLVHQSADDPMHRLLSQTGVECDLGAGDRRSGSDEIEDPSLINRKIQ